MSNWHLKPIGEVFTALCTSPAGLDQNTVQQRQKEYGLNRLLAKGSRSVYAVFFSQFKSVIIIVLVAAALISFIAGERTDSYVILVILLLNATLGFYQEYKAEEAVRKLNKLAAPFAMVVREGTTQLIDAVELVPGDVVILNAGDIIPADGRLFETSAFEADEAVLTGESQSVYKTTVAIEGESVIPADMVNMAFKGTTASNGTAKMVVTATGMQTETGKIAALLEHQPEKTPLQARLGIFSRQLVIAVLLICLVVFGLGLYNGQPFIPIFLTAVSLAVAALPEALPAVITIALSRGAGVMARENALVRRLPAVETLGSVTYICTDKTGTLTLNKMTVEKIWHAEGLQQLFLYNLLLNNSVKVQDHETLLGEATEVALVKYAIQCGLSPCEVQRELPFEEELPFDSERMRMSTLHQYGDKYLLLVKGAPVKMIEALASPIGEQAERLLRRNRQWASEGLRVLFFAYKIFDAKPAVTSHSIEQGLQFLGMAGLIDPPRAKVYAAIRQCHTAGIKTVMITGDQPLTATAIARKLAMCEGEPKALTGKEMALLSDSGLARTVKDVTVYARVTPEQKLRIVKALQENREFVAMTGDGVNDAPALKRANIGVAMGITGSEVSKEAAHLILLDDNFATIVKAVKEGRRIYSNLKRFILYVLSCNLGEIIVVLLSPAFGLPIPLLPIHILWINLITDGLPGVALSAEPATDDIMQKPPRPVNESFFSGGMLYRILVSGFVMGAGAIGLQYFANTEGYTTEQQQAMVFSMLCFSQLGNAFLLKRLDRSIFAGVLHKNAFLSLTIVFMLLLQVAAVSIPWAQSVLKTTSLPLQGWAYTAAGALVVLCLLEAAKLAVTYIISKK